MQNLVESLEKVVVKLRRRRVSKSLFDKFDGVIQAGPFAGLKLDRHNTSSKGQLGLKILGLYESVVIEAIERLGPFGDLVNIGACDGYFSLGLLRADWVRRSICFETEQARQQAIKRYAADNRLADRLTVLGQAGIDIGKQIAEHDFQPARSLMICDIEGAEFELLSESFLAQLDGATMVIELHDRVMSGAANPMARDDLIRRLPCGYDHELLVWRRPDCCRIEALEELSDNDRALVLSEGRKVRGEWLLAWPKQNGLEVHQSR